MKKIQEQFNRVLQYSQPQYVAKPQTEQILAAWAKNKDWFRSSVNSLIYEIPNPVTFDLDDESRKNKVDQFLSWIHHEYGEDMYLFFKEHYDGILENKLTHEYCGFPRGTRLSKVLMKQFGVDAEQVRQELSMLIQSNKVTGKLCISIHPLDYLSASENNHSWRSCHALDGEYRVGNVSYMMDDCTIIAYLKSTSGDVKLPHFPEDVPWNDKKWRCYFYVDRVNKLIYAGRQYPFHSDAALEMVANVIRDTFYYFASNEQKQMELKEFRRHQPLFWRLSSKNTDEITWQDYLDEMVPHYTFQPVGMKGETVINGHIWSFDETKVICGYGSRREIVPVTKFIETDRDACCFNDVIQSHTYAPWIMAYNNDSNCLPDPSEIHQKLVVGKGVPCICCGERQVADSDTFFCSMCRDDERECTRCGCTGNDSNMHYVDGEWYCDECYSDLFDN